MLNMGHVAEQRWTTAGERGLDSQVVLLTWVTEIYERSKNFMFQSGYVAL